MPFNDGIGPLGFRPGYGGGYGPPRRQAGRGYGRGFGRGYGWRCQQYPWLPRWWWADPEYQGDYPPQPTVKQEREILGEEVKALREELKDLETRLQELKETKKKK